jgi:hypothetical protein
MQHRISSTTTVTLGVDLKKAAPLLALLAKREEVKHALQRLTALQDTRCSELRDKAIADLNLQVAVLKEEELECHQLFKDSLKP